GDRERLRLAGYRPADRAGRAAARLPPDPDGGDRHLRGLRARQPVGRPALSRGRSAHPLRLMDIEQSVPIAAPLAEEASLEPGPLRQWWQDLRTSRKGSSGAAIVLLMLLVTLLVPVLPIADPTAQ